MNRLYRLSAGLADIELRLPLCCGQPAVAGWLLLSAVLVVTNGCATSMIEQRVIEQFSDALDEENEPALRRATSTRFEHKAMRSDDVLTDLEVLHLPTGELEVVEVEEETADRRRVTVKEESGSKYQFVIVRDAAKDRWVVDDVMVRQRNKGTRITKSTTEVMDLLLTLREFLKTWSHGSRTEVLAMVSPELHQSLAALPDAWMTALTARVAANYEEGMARRPEAQLNVDDAVVKLPAKQGYLLVSMIREDDNWLIDDIELINRRDDEHPGSIRRQANAIATVTTFLNAYSAGDRDTLKQVADSSLFQGALEFADLSMVSLPEGNQPPNEFDIRAFSDNLTIMIPGGQDLVRFDLHETEATKAGTASEQPAGSFRIREVVLYERGSQRQRNLSSVFTAPTRATLFLSALQQRDLTMLGQLTTDEFSRTSWKRIRPESLGMLPLPNLPAQQLQLTASNMRGHRTDLQFVAPDGSALSVVLLNENGSLKVDDVQYPDQDGQTVSLKTQLSLATPLVEFAAGWQDNQLKVVQMASSNNFNRLVWSHLQDIPQRPDIVLYALAGPLQDMRITLDRATISCGSPSAGLATVTLIQEQGFWVIDEIELPNTAGQPIALRKLLREQVAKTMLYSTSSGRTVQTDQQLASGIQPAGYINGRPVTTNPESAVRTAVYTRELEAGDGSGTRPQGRAAQPFGFPQQTGSGIQQLNHTQQQQPRIPIQEAVDETTGLQVFGPNASEIALKPKSGAPAADLRPAGTSGSLPSPEVTDAAAVRADSDGMLRFGPAAAAPTSRPAASAEPRAGHSESRVSEPADQPIPLF